MSEVQNIGAVDYAQYQPSQISQEADVENYNTQPEIYDENYAQIQAANKSRVGATLMSALVLGGLAVLGGYSFGKHSAKNAKKALEELKNSEAVQNYDKVVEALDKVQKVTEKCTGTMFGEYRCGEGVKEMIDKIIERAKNFKKPAKTVEKSADEIADSAK